jgi:hypothetical protein
MTAPAPAQMGVRSSPGARTQLLSLELGEIQAVEGDINPTRKLPVDGYTFHAWM